MKVHIFVGCAGCMGRGAAAGTVRGRGRGGGRPRAIALRHMAAAIGLYMATLATPWPPVAPSTPTLLVRGGSVPVSTACNSGCC
jgi:hypothetical protein